MKQFCLNIVGTGGTGVAGATLSWTDGTAKTATADGTGFYQFPVSYDWSGTVTPSLAGYTFTNPSTTYSHVLANQQANYTAAAVAIAISGNAGVAGATLSWTDGSANTVTASGTGAYTLIVPYNWSGTVTPSLAGYGFTSSSTLYTNILTNQTTNYTATITGYAIGGSVTAGSAIAYAGTTTGTLAGSATAGGTFVLNLPIGWTGTVTATLAGYTFPTSTVAPLAANLTLNLPGNSGDLASFAFLKANNPALAADDFGVISGNTILVKVPVGLAVTSLVATYVTSGSSVLIAGIPQTSGTTANNFTSPLVYVVQPRGVNYTVTVAPGALSVIGTYVNATGAPQAFFINNGTRIPLNLPAMTGASKLSVTAITRDAGTGSYYILGGYTADGGGNDMIGCYWQSNGVSATRYDFEPADLDQAPNSIQVSGGAVTITGQKNFSNDKATLWTGPATGALVAAPLPDPTTFQDLSDNIQGGAVHQGVPYISGTYVRSNYSIAQPVYWQGSNAGIDAPRPGGMNSAEIMALFSDGTTLFGGGMATLGYLYNVNSTQYLPCYWVAGAPWTVNSLASSLPAGSTAGQILRIAGDGQNTYFAGWHNTASSASVPCFWNYSASTPAPAPADLPRLAGSTGGKAVFATASAGAVYFSGYFTSAGVQHPCYWPASGAYVDLAAALPAGNQGGSATGVIFQ